MGQAPFIPVDIASADFKRLRHEHYARWREFGAIRLKLKGPARAADEALLVTRYSDVSSLLKDPLLVKDSANAGLLPPTSPKLFRPLLQNMLAKDDPEHARLKMLVQRTFTPVRVAMLKDRTEAVSHDLISALRGRRSFDLMQEYAFPLPVTVISELLGVPMDDRSRFAKWSGALIRAGTSTGSLITSIPQVVAFLRYLEKLIAWKKADPGDDLVSALVQAEEEGQSLNGDELMAMVAILLSAGHETTANLIANGTLALLDNPEAAASLRSGQVPIETAVEELLRFAGPVETSTPRYASTDMTIAGIDTARGTLVLGAIASANRDNRQFAHADQIDLERRPNRHLTFGEGGHYCVGAALARMESAIAFRQILEHFPNIKLAVPAESLRWRQGLVLTGLRHLLVTV
jgi:cytochrome P450